MAVRTASKSYVIPANRSRRAVALSGARKRGSGTDFKIKLGDSFSVVFFTATVAENMRQCSCFDISLQEVVFALCKVVATGKCSSLNPLKRSNALH